MLKIVLFEILVIDHQHYNIIFFNNTLCCVYGAVENWLSGALVNVGDMI